MENNQKTIEEINREIERFKKACALQDNEESKEDVWVV